MGCHNQQCFYRDTISRKAAIQGYRHQHGHETRLSPAGRHPGISIPRVYYYYYHYYLLLLLLLFIVIIIIIVIYCYYYYMIDDIKLDLFNVKKIITNFNSFKANKITINPDLFKVAK